MVLYILSLKNFYSSVEKHLDSNSYYNSLCSRMYPYDNADYNLIDRTSGHCWGPVMDIIGERDKQQREMQERGILMT